MDEDFDLFEIDETNLFGEWKYQSPRVRQTADKHAAALKKHREEEAKLKVVRAELSRRIRMAPEDYGLTKVTEAALEEAVLVSKKFQEQQQAVIEAQFEADIYSGWLRALENKKKGLEKTTEMILSGLKAEPRLPKDIDPVQMDRLKKAAGKPKGGISRDEVLGKSKKKEK